MAFNDEIRTNTDAAAKSVSSYTPEGYMLSWIFPILAVFISVALIFRKSKS